MTYRAALLAAIVLAGCGGATSVAARSATSTTGPGPTAVVTAETSEPVVVVPPATTVPTTPVPTTRITTPTTSTTPPLTTVTTATAGASGVRGTVTAGPTCAVERAGHPCPPHSVQVDLQLLGPSGAVAAAGRSGADGTFSLTAPPGDDTLETAPGSSPYPRCPLLPLVIRAGQFTTANMSCDTGIR